MFLGHLTKEKSSYMIIERVPAKSNKPFIHCTILQKIHEIKDRNILNLYKQMEKQLSVVKHKSSPN